MTGSGGTGFGEEALAAVRGLEAYWLHHSGRRRRDPEPRTWLADKILLDTLGLGLEQTRGFLGDGAPDFGGFARWILTKAGAPDPLAVARYHAWLVGAPQPAEVAERLAAIEAAPPVLDAAALVRWRDEGYVVVPAAIGASPNRAARPRLVHYLNMYSGNRQRQAVWR